MRTGTPGALHAPLPAADRGQPAGLARAPGAVTPPCGQRAAAGALDLLFAALVQNPHALSIHQAIWRALGQLRHPANWSTATASSPSTPFSISTRTSACAAGIAAPNCSGNARIATTGIRSSRNVSLRRRTRRKWKSSRRGKAGRAGRVRQVNSYAQCVESRVDLASVSSNVPSCRDRRCRRGRLIRAGSCAASRGPRRASACPARAVADLRRRRTDRGDHPIEIS